MTLCECGCGGEASPGSRFIRGHNLRVKHHLKGKHMSEEAKNKKRINKEIKEGKRPAPELPFCKCGCGGRVTKPENMYITGHHRRGKESPMKGKIPWNKGKTKETDERVMKNTQSLSKSLKMFFQTEKGKKQAKETSNRFKGVSPWSEGLTKETDERVKKIAEIRSEKMLENWQNPEFIKMMVDSWYGKGQTKPEKELEGIVHLLFPKEYKYNGNFELGITIGRKIPDFVNVNGKKKAIEMFGDWCHRDDDPQIRINLFNEYGWDLLVIWEHELKDKDAVIQRILKFHGLESDYVIAQKTLDMWVDNNKKIG